MGQRFWCLLSLGLVWLALPGLGRAQPRKYVPIPFDGNLEQMLRQHLNESQQLDELLKKLKKWNIDPKRFENMDWQRPEVMKKIEKVLEQNPAIANVPPEKRAEVVKKLTQDMDKLKRQQQIPEKKIVPRKTPRTPPRQAAEADVDLEDRFSRWAQDVIKQAEGTEFGDMILDSPAWQEGLRDFQKFLLERDAFNPNWALSLPRNVDWSLFEKTWWRIDALPVPELPSLNVRFPGLSIGGNPLPSLPNIPGSGNLVLGQTVLWIVVGVGLAIVLWQVFQRAGGPLRAEAGVRLGPWPVDPARVTTAAQLIAAFEYLARLRLGNRARAWNHRFVAGRLAAGSIERRRAAHELAELYEHARYAPDVLAFSEDVLSRARRQLCFLAEAPS
jgi:hypothetical protein